MTRLAAIVAIASVAGVSVGSCAPAVRHPAITAGIFGGVVGFGGCYLQGTDADKCAGIGAVAGVGLGAIAALVLLLSPPDPHGGVLGGGGVEGTGSDEPVPVFGHKRYYPDAGVPVVAPPVVVPDAGVASDATP